MDKTELEQLAVAYADNADVLQVYQDWGDTVYLQELFAALNRYEPDWNKEKELGSWAAEFILDILQEEEGEWEHMTKEERAERFDELLDDRYEDCHGGHQFARVNNINLRLKEGEELGTVLAESDEQVSFPILPKKH